MMFGWVKERAGDKTSCVKRRVENINQPRDHKTMILPRSLVIIHYWVMAQTGTSFLALMITFLWPVGCPAADYSMPAVCWGNYSTGR